MNSSQIYNPKALDKLKHAEKAGAVFSITTSTGWIALAAVGISVFSILVWAFFGVMADQVTGYGIISNDSGVATIAPSSSGRILEMRRKPGEKVEKGDVVAIIEQTQLEQQIYLDAERARTASNFEDMRARTAQLASAKEEYHRQAQVISPYAGTILSQRLREGEMISQGTSLYDVNVKEGQDLMGVVFVPALVGNKLKPGSVVHVSPGAIDSSLYGSLVGTVTDLSRYPVTSDRVAYWTGNREFASWIVQRCGGAMMEVRVELTRDRDTKSGYLWTTLQGPDETIQDGMTCTATAVIDRKSPAAYAFDKLGQWLRTD